MLSAPTKSTAESHSGGSATLPVKCGASTTRDYVHWSAGNLTGYDRIMDFKVYNLG